MLTDLYTPPAALALLLGWPRAQESVTMILLLHLPCFEKYTACAIERILALQAHSLTHKLTVSPSMSENMGKSGFCKDTAAAVWRSPWAMATLPSHRWVRPYAPRPIPQALARTFIWAPSDRGMRLIMEMSPERLLSPGISWTCIALQTTTLAKKLTVTRSWIRVVFSQPLRYLWIWG